MINHHQQMVISLIPYISVAQNKAQTNKNAHKCIKLKSIKFVHTYIGKRQKKSYLLPA